MAITITGHKETGTLTVVSSLALIDSTANFVGGFDTARMAYLYRGGVLIAIARVRARTSNTELSLDSPFFDIDGEEVTQQVGDTYYISQNFAEIAQANIIVSGNTVTLTDRIDFGTAGNNQSCFFHDEDKSITTNQGGGSAGAFQAFGGVASFGNPLNLKERVVAGECSFDFTTTASAHGFTTNNISGSQLHFGSSFKFTGNNTGRMPGGAGSGGFTPGFWQLFVNCTSNGNMVTPSGGANWASRADFQRLINLQSAGRGTNLLNSRWGDGFFEGGSFQNQGDGLAPFGTDAAGTYNIAALPRKRISVFDTARDALWRSASNPVQIINFKNMLVADQFKGAIGGNKTFNFIFADFYENLKEGTKLRIEDNTQTVVKSETIGVTGESTVIELTNEIRDPNTGISTFFAPFQAGFFRYGFELIFIVIEETTNSVAGRTVKDMFFGGQLVQAPDFSISDQDASVIASLQVNVSFDGTTWLIEGIGGTIRTITAFQLYDLIALYMQNNFGGQDIRVSRVGDIIDAVTNNVNITLDNIEYIGSITLDTSKTVILTNGSTVSGGIIDSNGDSFLTFVGIDVWSVHESQNDANLDINSLGSGLNNDIYRFTFSSGKNYYLRLIVAGDVLFKQITPTESGETQVSLTQVSILQALDSRVSLIETKEQADIRQTQLISKHDQTQSEILNLNNLSLEDVEVSTILAKEITLQNIISDVAQIPTTDSVADITPVIDAISSLPEAPTAQAIREAFNEADFKDKNTEVELHSWLDSYSNKNEWKSESSSTPAFVLR